MSSRTYRRKRYPPLRSSKARRSKTTIAKVNKKVNRLINKQEKKFIDTIVTYSPVTTTASHNNLSIPSIAEGSTANEREGQKITLKSIQIKGQMEVGYGTNPDNFNQMRIILVKYMTHGSTPIPMNQILQQYDPATYASETQMQSVYRKNSTFRYKVLYDKVHLLTYRLAEASGTHTYVPIQFRINCKVKNGDLHYSDVGNPTGWAYSLLYFSDSGAVSNPHISFVSRVTFVDA